MNTAKSRLIKTTETHALILKTSSGERAPDEVWDLFQAAMLLHWQLATLAG